MMLPSGRLISLSLGDFRQLFKVLGEVVVGIESVSFVELVFLAQDLD